MSPCRESAPYLLRHMHSTYCAACYSAMPHATQLRRTLLSHATRCSATPHFSSYALRYSATPHANLALPHSPWLCRTLLSYAAYTPHILVHNLTSEFSLFLFLICSQYRNPSCLYFSPGTEFTKKQNPGDGPSTFQRFLNAMARP